MSNLMWFLPTFHGDIQLEKKGPEETVLRAFELTPTEEVAMATLREHAIKKGLVRKPWATAKDFIAISSPSYRTSAGVTITLRAKIEAVQKVLAKALKPERSLLTAVRFMDGRIEEVREPKSEKKEPAVLELPKEEPKAAVTVAKPVVGCPMPEFPEADVRASRVLEAFLDPDQIRDYRETGAFVTRGADTGRRYLVANRERPSMLKKCGGRQLFDLEENRALCVHDWSVPPPEEMLALHLFLVTPGNESYIRTLPETYEEEQGTGTVIRW
jgi:hypothetical protein